MLLCFGNAGVKSPDGLPSKFPSRLRADARCLSSSASILSKFSSSILEDGWHGKCIQFTRVSRCKVTTHERTDRMRSQHQHRVTYRLLQHQTLASDNSHVVLCLAEIALQVNNRFVLLLFIVPHLNQLHAHISYTSQERRGTR